AAIGLCIGGGLSPSTWPGSIIFSTIFSPHCAAPGLHQKRFLSTPSRSTRGCRLIAAHQTTPRVDSSPRPPPPPPPPRPPEEGGKSGRPLSRHTSRAICARSMSSCRGPRPKESPSRVEQRRRSRQRSWCAVQSLAESCSSQVQLAEMQYVDTCGFKPDGLIELFAGSVEMIQQRFGILQHCAGPLGVAQIGGVHSARGEKATSKAGAVKILRLRNEFNAACTVDSESGRRPSECRAYACHALHWA